MVTHVVCHKGISHVACHRVSIRHNGHQLDNHVVAYCQLCHIHPRWVDEQHALLLFSDPADVRQALKAWPPGLLVRVRGFLEASPAARLLPPEALQPAKRRPRTTTAVARRMIGNALSMCVCVRCCVDDVYHRRLRDKGAEEELAAARRNKAAARRAQSGGARADAAFGD